MRTITIISLVVLGVVARLMPHWPNFTPVLASAIFAGVYLRDKKLALLVPVVTMLLSDLFLGIHPGMVFVYAALLLVTLIGVYVGKKPSVGKVAMASVASSVLFYLITNFESWVNDPFNMYTNDFSGLMASYVAGLAFINTGGLPYSFFTNQLLGDLFYTGVIFGVFYLVQQRVPALKPVKATV